jgi:hypothetical protein
MVKHLETKDILLGFVFMIAVMAIFYLIVGLAYGTYKIKSAPGYQAFATKVETTPISCKYKSGAYADELHCGGVVDALNLELHEIARANGLDNHACYKWVNVGVGALAREKTPYLNATVLDLCWAARLTP